MVSPTKVTKKDVFLALLPVVTIVLFIIAWQLLVQLQIIPARKMASPIQIGEAFIFKISNTGPDGATLGTNILASLLVSMSGLILGIVVGVPLGLLMGWYRLFDRFLHPIFDIIRPIPPVAWIPLLIIWVGLGLEAKALIIFVSSFVPCVINSYTGIRLTNRVFINVATTFGASNFYTFIHVGIPSSTPMIFAGIRLSLGVSWSTLVAAEMLSASSGLGYMMNMSRNFGRIDVVMLGMIVIGILGYSLTGIFGLIEKKIVKGRTML